MLVGGVFFGGRVKGETMDELSCALCGMALKNKDLAYGLTPGIIDEHCDGFRVDDDSSWDLYCADCMNEIDRLILSRRQGAKR